MEVMAPRFGCNPQSLVSMGKQTAHVGGRVGLKLTCEVQESFYFMIFFSHMHGELLWCILFIQT